MRRSVSLRLLAIVGFLFCGQLAELTAQPPEGEPRRGQRDGGGRRGQGGFRGFGGFGGMQRGGFGGGPGLNLDRATALRSDKIRDELKMDDVQKATIDAALEAYSEEARGARPDFGSFRDMSDEERQAAVEKMQKDMQEMSRRGDETLGILLEPDQLERLDQVILQARIRMNPFGTLQDEELRTKLALTDDQVNQLKEVETAANEKQQERQRQMFEQFRGGGNAGGPPDFESIREQMETVQKENRQNAMAILTKEQQADLTGMQGDEFEVDMRDLFGGGRGGRGRGFGGGGFGGFGRGGGPGGGPGGGRPDGNRGGRRRNQRPPIDDEA